jgi:hypothetical protein
MRVSEFWLAVEQEFGADYGRALVRDVVLGELGDRTAEQAIAFGVPTKDIWLALCRAMDVAENRWYGVGGLPKG